MRQDTLVICPYCEQAAPYRQRARSEYGYTFAAHKMPKLKDYKSNNCPMSGRGLPDFRRLKVTTP